MRSREQILGRACAALRDRPAIPAAAPEPTAARVPGDLAERFRERVEDYRATVSRCAPRDVATTVGAILARHGARRVVAPAGLDLDVPRLGREPLAAAELATVDGVVTACRLAIAETGTIVLDGGPDQGPRILTLLPDLHVCVVRADQVVADVPDAIDRLAGTTAPITFISGPSATSDIELERVEGVHGPRRLEVVLAGAARGERA